MRKKIFIFSSSRAEFYLLRELFFKINKTKNLSAKFILTGTHTNQNYGLSKSEIKKSIKKKYSFLKIPQNSKDELSILKCVGESTKKFGKFLKKYNPDGVILLGDRYEILSAGIASLFLKIPIIHLHGGEVTTGAIDENIRHAISKFSTYHFVSNEKYKKRIIQLGEIPKNIFCVGSIGVENALKSKLISKKKLEEKINFKFKKNNFLITFHAETYKKDLGIGYFRNLLSVLSEYKNTNFIFTRPNADLGSKKIFDLIKRFIKKNKNSKLVLNLGQEKYFSILKHFDGVIGNSSSGIIEAPSLNCVTLNIGKRQNGRLMSKSVITCYSSNKKELRKKFNYIKEKNYPNNSYFFRNPYFKPNTSSRIVSFLKKVDLKKVEIKSFFDIKF